MGMRILDRREVARRRTLKHSSPRGPATTRFRASFVFTSTAAFALPSQPSRQRGTLLKNLPQDADQQLGWSHLQSRWMAALRSHPISGVPLHHLQYQPHARIWGNVLGLIPQVQRRACMTFGPWSREDTAEMNTRPGGATGRRARLKIVISGSSSLPLGTKFLYT